jgi:hypothetical protein
VGCSCRTCDGLALQPTRNPRVVPRARLRAHPRQRGARAGEAAAGALERSAHHDARGKPANHQSLQEHDLTTPTNTEPRRPPRQTRRAPGAPDRLVARAHPRLRSFADRRGRSTSATSRLSGPTEANPFAWKQVDELCAAHADTARVAARWREPARPGARCRPLDHLTRKNQAAAAIAREPAEVLNALRRRRAANRASVAIGRADPGDGLPVGNQRRGEAPQRQLRANELTGASAIQNKARGSVRYFARNSESDEATTTGRSPPTMTTSLP